MESRLYCDSCRNTFKDLSECPYCKDEPLLDLNDPEVRLLLEEQDEKDLRKKLTQLTFVAMPLAIPVPVVVYLVGFRPLTSLVAYGLAVVGITKILAKVFVKPGRFPKLP